MALEDVFRREASRESITYGVEVSEPSKNDTLLKALRSPAAVKRHYHAGKFSPTSARIAIFISA
jgi:hypothetical protein